MKYRKTAILKNGVECLIRNGEGSDGKAVYDNFNITHSQTDFLLTYPDENIFDVEQESLFLTKMEQSEDEVLLCAVMDGQIIGTAGVEAVGRKDKVKHRATLGISIDKEFWGLGIGRLLTEACIECAKDAGYLQLELSVVSENHRAIKLYDAIGFCEYGRNSKGFRSRNGNWQEVVLMRMDLLE